MVHNCSSVLQKLPLAVPVEHHPVVGHLVAHSRWTTRRYLVVHLVVRSCWTIQRHLVGHTWWVVWWPNFGGPSGGLFLLDHSTSSGGPFLVGRLVGHRVGQSLVGHLLVDNFWVGHCLVGQLGGPIPGGPFGGQSGGPIGGPE